jgi:hypothetical protein
MRHWLTSSLLALCCVGLPAGAQTPQRMQLVFWHAGDCPPCKAWERGERRSEFIEQAGPLGIGLVSVFKPSLMSPASAFAWPPEHQTLRTGLSVLPVPELLPSFDFVCNGQLVRRLQGLADWDSFWRSQARLMARECSASKA